MAPGSGSRFAGLRGPYAALLAAGILVVALSVTALVLSLRPASTGAPTASATPTPTVSPTATATPSVADIYQMVGPSVVVVQTDKGSTGTGVVVSDDGAILTANHVVSGGGTVTVVFSDGTKTTATVASSDPDTDIAALAPDTLPQTLVPAALGGSTEIGGQVVAIGNPLGLTLSVSSGVISGTDREATTPVGKFSGLIQFDAAVNSGSSGGPLVDAAGGVVGIVVSIADPGHDDAFAGIGFAVPIGAALGGGGSDGSGQGPQI